MAGQDTDQKTPDQISDEIRQTRANMRRTLDALETKLSPARLRQEATSTIRNQTVGRAEDIADSAGRTMKGASADVFETIKDHPLPAALAAIGIGWLFMERRNEGRRYAPRPSDRGREFEYGYRYYERPGEFEQSPRPMRETAGQMRETARQTADQAKDRASQKAGQAQDKAVQVAGQARDQADEWSGAAQEQVGRVRSRLEDAMDENPLLVGAAAVALGAAIGMSLPQTPQEDRIMGQARDTLMDRAQATAMDTMEKVQQVAEKAGTAAKETAKDEAQEQNLTS